MTLQYTLSFMNYLQVKVRFCLVVYYFCLALYMYFIVMPTVLLCTIHVMRSHGGPCQRYFCGAVPDAWLKEMKVLSVTTAL